MAHGGEAKEQAGTKALIFPFRVIAQDKSRKLFL